MYKLILSSLATETDAKIYVSRSMSNFLDSSSDSLPGKTIRTLITVFMRHRMNYEKRMNNSRSCAKREIYEQFQSFVTARL